MVAALALHGPAAHAQHVRWTSAIGVEGMWTDNVGLESSQSARSDFVSRIVPSLAVRHRGPHSELTGTLSVPAVFYAHSSEDNNVYPLVALAGRIEAVPRLLLIEGAIDVSRQSFSPFGPRPVDVAYVTNNQYTSQTYRISPVLRWAQGAYEVELRDDNIYTNESQSAFDTQSSYTNTFRARMRRKPGPYGYALDYIRDDLDYSREGRQLSQVARAVALYSPEPRVELSADAGYERNDFPLSDYEGAVYGVGVRWRPNRQTSLDAAWEHRFFGSSYLVRGEYRTARSTLSLLASRDVTSYADQRAQPVQLGGVASLLDDIFRSRYPDRELRQEAIRQYMRENGLPDALSGPVTVYVPQVYLQESLGASFGWVWPRDTLLVNLYRQRTQTVNASGQTIDFPQLALDGNNTQVGGSAAWTRRLSLRNNLIASLDLSRTTANENSDDRTRQGAARLTFERRVTPRTTAFLTLRYQRSISTIIDSWRERAIILGLTHSFR